MDKCTRNSIQRATQATRKLLEADYREQLEGTYDILLDGTIAERPGPHLSDGRKILREKLVAAVEHKRSTGLKNRDAVDAYLREAAFTTLNRFVALKVLESRQLIQECVSKGEDSLGFKEFLALAPGLVSVPDRGYRRYIETVFDEIGQEVGVLFDRRDVVALLWPGPQALLELLATLNDAELAGVWSEDETIGWVYQYFNGDDERRQMRSESQTPRSSRELAVRNQFFTPRYVVQFLTDNTLGRTWYEMMQGETKLADLAYLVDRPNEVFLADGETVADFGIDDDKVGQAELRDHTVYVPFRAKKDPRDLRILDPACGSGHFLLYAFELLLSIYEEAWSDAGAATFTGTGTCLLSDYDDVDALRCAVPELILRHNLHGVDIDARAAQIAAFALWVRAQRAYFEFGITRMNRLPITKTNIVVAEPMPGNAELVSEFAASLVPTVLGELFKKMIEEMKLAGELGSLLTIEDSIARVVTNAAEATHQGDLFGAKIESQDFWDTADQKIVLALATFAKSAGGSRGVRRQLFAGDAARGVAFIELMRKQFDVVLMNPPFGQPVVGQFQVLRDTFRGAHNDIYAAMVARGLRLAQDGRVGAITSRAFLVARRMEEFRGAYFIPTVELLFDLGNGVMDGALVESAAYVLAPGRPNTAFLVADAREQAYSGGRKEAREWRKVDGGQLRLLPGSRVLYDLPPDVFRALSSRSRFEPEWGTAREGMKTFDDFRFLRLRWEVPAEDIGWSEMWRTYAKGGQFCFFLLELPLVLNWSDDGAQLSAVNIAANGSTSQVRQASTYWGQSGATYSRRSAAGFSARALPGESVFSTKGPAVLRAGFENDAVLLGWLNSRLIRTLIHLQASASDFMTGILKSLPVPALTEEVLAEIGRNTRGILRELSRLSSFGETSPYFVGPAAVQNADCCLLGKRLPISDVALQKIETWVVQTNRLVDNCYGVDSSSWGTVCPVPEFAPRAGNSVGTMTALVSWTIGRAFGRFDIPSSEGARAEREFDPFQPLPRLPPACRSDCTSRMEELDVLTCDAGTPSDICRASTIALQSLELAAYDDDAIAAGLGKPLRAWFRENFFSIHLEMYSQSRRSSPIYWQLATPSASYSVWCYYHRLNRDTFFRILREYVGSKVDHEEGKLNALRQEAGAHSPNNRRKAIAAQENLVDELRTFKVEMTRIAPLWYPNLNDGVIINFAPLWRLVPQNRSWQKDCKTVWDELVKGDYDWAHLAMHLWPERVVPKCKDDRSLAIAHGLEEQFWHEDDKGKWQNRDVDEVFVTKLISERSSTAVKAALHDLLSAPTPGGNGNSRSRRRGGAS